MIILRYILLILILLNIPTFSLIKGNATLGSLTNTLMFVGIIVYFFISKKNRPILSLITLGIAYFTISGLNYSGITETYFKDMFRYFIFVIGVIAVAKDTSEKELLVIFTVGAISVLINALVFPDSYGRYSGLYINPNRAGLICLLGFAFTYIISNIKLRLTIQFIITIAGIMTLSRYFILILVLINVISIFADRKNALGLIAGAFALLIILTSSSLQLNADRFSALQSLFSDNVDTKTITKESRGETWALYEEVLLDNPILGVGYRGLQGGHNPNIIQVGVHNTYLMTLGEAGIITLILLILLYIALIIRSIKLFSTHPEYSYLVLILCSFLLVSHNFYDNYMILFPTIWLYTRVKQSEKNLIINTQ